MSKNIPSKQINNGLLNLKILKYLVLNPIGKKEAPYVVFYMYRSVIVKYTFSRIFAYVRVFSKTCIIFLRSFFQKPTKAQKNN